MSVSGSEPSGKERLSSSPQDEVILQLENELAELRNACAWKDQRIAELSRTDTAAARLKRDVRNLAAELHHTRKELSESVRELQELQAQLAKGDSSAQAPRDVVDRPNDAAPAEVAPPTPQSADRGNGNGDREKDRRVISELTDENRELRDRLMQLQAQTARQNGPMVSTGSSAVTAPARDPSFDSLHTRQPSGASTQRASDQPLQPSPNPAGSGYGAPDAARQAPFLGQQPSVGPGARSTSPTAASAQMQQHEELLQQVVYSTAHEHRAATIGPTMLQGVGMVDGVDSVAKVLLSRIHSSVCSAHRRGPGMMPGAPGQPGQMPMVPQGQMGMMQNLGMGH